MDAQKRHGITVTVANNGQIFIPEKIRQQLGLHDGDQLNLTVTKSGSLILDNGPTAQDWHTAIKDIPNEVVDVDESGHYDPKKSPAFDQWMREG